MSSKSNKSNKSNKNKSIRREINYEETNPYNQFQMQPQYFQQQPQYFQQQQFSPPPPQQFSPPQLFSQPQHFPPPNFPHYMTQESQEPNYTQMLNEENEDCDNDEEEVEVAASQKGKQRVQFSEAEDKFLAKSFIRISENAVKGNDNKIAMFWGRITIEYNSMATECGFEERNTSSLKNRFAKMRGEMVMYKQAVHMVNSVYHTGENEIGMLKRVKDKFMELNSKCKNRAFAFHHVVDILNKSSKFNYTTTRNRIPTLQDEGTNSSPDNGSPQSPIGVSRASTQQSNDPHSGDKRSRDHVDEGVSSPKRPMGNKAAKKLLKKGKEKVGGGSGKYEFSEKYFTHRETEFEFKREAHTAKIKAMENNMELEARRLSIKEEELRQKQEDRQWARELERDQQIMNMDINKLASDEEKAHLMAMRSAILRKWAQ